MRSLLRFLAARNLEGRASCVLDEVGEARKVVEEVGRAYFSE
jgi:hypothetical protein